MGIKMDRSKGISIEELAAKIASDPLQWVLFLGDGVSYDSTYDRKKVFAALVGEAEGEKEEAAYVKEMVYQAVWQGNYAGVSNALFGETWDGAAFLDETGKCQMRWRKQYAKGLMRREKININCASVNLEDILKVFPGMILTTCQDETIEAFLEYEKSVPVDDIVYTPYHLATSSEWDRWIGAKNSSRMNMVPDNDTQGNHLLVKLYGSCRKPYRMLLSEKDYMDYYPDYYPDNIKDWDNKMPNTMLFLEKIFRTKHILFVGMDFGREGPLSYGKGILKLLEDVAGNGERYIFYGDQGEAEKYGIRRVKNGSCSGGIGEFGKKLWQAVQDCQKNTACSGQDFRKDSNGEEKYRELSMEMSMEEALEEFWNYYNRRPYRDFLRADTRLACKNGTDNLNREMHILKEKILGFRGEETADKKWSRKSIRQLAIGANCVADFYDLEKVFQSEKKEVEKEFYPEKEEARLSKNIDSKRFYRIVTGNLLKKRLGSRSRRLHQILSFYGNGFPIGFLSLLSENEEELQQWKRAGIQLANSGIYVKRQQRKNLHERIIYADELMKTAGKNPNKKEFGNRIDEISHWTEESYFYSFDSDILTGEPGNAEKENLKKIFRNMLKKMYDILRDKSEGYNQMHFLLQTELPAIIRIMEKWGDSQPEWASALLYYLLCESCPVSETHKTSMEESGAVPETYKILTRLIKKLSSKPISSMEEGEKEEAEKLILNRILLLMSESMIASQSDKREGQELALEKISEAERLLESECGEEGRWKEMPENIFVQRIRVYILKSKICGRCSTVHEIDRCRREAESCEEQQKMLEAMRKNLEKAQSMISERENWLGNGYEELRAELDYLMGEYYFKMSQYYGENRRYNHEKEIKKEEEKSYADSQELYEKALEYYNKYPDRFWIERAGVMRSLADVYCQKAKEIGKQKAAEQKYSQNGKGMGEQKTEEQKHCKEKAYKMLIEAYVLYRSNSDLYGIADVLQSMGHLDGFMKRREGIRSPVCFYKAAKNFYDYLNDEWSSFVVSGFLESADGDEKRAAGSVRVEK